MEVYDTPGHCPASLVLHVPGHCFVGDVLFRGSVGRVDLPGGSMELLAESIRRHLYVLPDETIVYPGHGPETSIGEEKRSNPFVRG